MKLPNAKIDFDSGTDPKSAANLAKAADHTIVFAYQWLAEDMDVPSLSLPDNQDALIEQVAAANPHTIVVLETGTAVTMPAYAYDDRWTRMTMLQFFRMRLIRLHPLVLIGATLGLLGYV